MIRMNKAGAEICGLYLLPESETFKWTSFDLLYQCVSALLFVCYEHHDLGNWKCYVLLIFLTYLQCSF